MVGVVRVWRLQEVKAVRVVLLPRHTRNVQTDSAMNVMRTAHEYGPYHNDGFGPSDAPPKSMPYEVNIATRLNSPRWLAMADIPSPKTIAGGISAKVLGPPEGMSAERLLEEVAMARSGLS